MSLDRRGVAVAIAGFCTFINLYTTQPLLAEFATEFGVPPRTAALTVTAPLLAVACVAPLVGSVSDALGRRRLIVGACAALVVPTLLAATARSFSGLLLWRFLQGLALPFIFAVTVAYIGEECPGAAGIRTTGHYAIGTILGGFSGRFLAGIVTQFAGWRAAFVLLGALTAIGAVLVAAWLPPERRFRPVADWRGTLGGFAANLTDARLIAAYVTGFGVLFSMIAAFTYANFYLADPPFRLGPAALGSVFVVYLLGAIATPLSSRMAMRMGRRRALICSIPVALAGCAVALLPSLAAAIAGLGLIAAAVFVEQTYSIGFVGAAARRARSTAVGLYVTCYYVGGSLGGVVPGGLWHRFGWPGCVALVAAVQAAMLVVALLFWQDEPAPTPARQG